MRPRSRTVRNTHNVTRPTPLLTTTFWGFHFTQWRGYLNPQVLNVVKINSYNYVKLTSSFNLPNWLIFAGYCSSSRPESIDLLSSA